MTDTYRPEDLDWAMGQFRSNDERNTRRVLTDPTAPNPDEEAQVRRVAQQSGLPDADVRLDLGAGERAATAAATGEALQQTPRLRDWMNDPRNAHVARDDVENLSVFERLSRQISDASGRALYNVTRLAQGGGRSGEEQGNADNMAVLALNPLTSPFALPYVTARMLGGDQSRQIGEQFRQGQLDTEYGRLAFRSHQAQIGSGDALTPEEQARLDELAGREGQENWGPLVLGPTARLAPQMLGSLERAGRQTLARVEENAATVGNPWELPEGERWTARRVLLDGPVGTGILAATTPIAAFGGFAGGYFGYGNEMETGLAYDQMIRAGVDPTIAADRATQYGAWATALEFAGDALGLRFSGLLRIGARAVLGDMALDAGTSAASRLTQSLISTSLDQGAEEASQELAQIIHQDLAQTETRRGTRTPGLTDDPAGYAQDVLSGWRAALTPESIQQILLAGYVGAQGGLGMGAVPASTNFALDMRANAVAERNARVFEEMTRAAQSSRLNERGLTDTLQSAVGAATDQSNVYIDADRFVEHFQSAGVNPYVVADELGLGGESLSQALAAHGQLEIPTSTFAARVLRVPEHAGLAEHARISPTDATPAEVKVATEVLRADIERIAQETEIAQSDNEIGAMVEARMRDLFARAETEGGPRAAVANRYARLVAAMPRAVLARARATNPAYADRLEPQLRRLFGERLDVAGPTRDLDAAPGSALNQDPKKRGTEPFNDARLTARQNKIVEMARNGYPPREIADEMEISASNVSVTLDKIKKKFPDITLPQHKRGGMEGRGAATIEQLVALRAKLLASGYGGLRGGAAHGGEGINSIIAQRFGMEPGNVAKRLSTWDKQQREAAAAGAVSEAASEPAPSKRRSDIYDLPTTEAREEWFKEPGNVISEAIPGEALDSRSYGFALDNGIIVTVEIAPEPTGAATISWTFLHRTLSGAEPFADGEEHLTIRGKGQLLSRIQAVIEADIAEFGRDAYVWTPESDGRMRANRAMIARADGTWPYRLVRAGSDDYLVRDGASVSLMGEVRPSPENAGKEGKWDEDQDQQSIEARKEAFNERLQNELGQAEADQRDGGRSDDLGRGGLEPAGGSAGTRGAGSLNQNDVSAGDPPLIAVHNTTGKKLLHAIRMGGMAVPSLAVARADVGMDNFGDITLIAPPSMVDPRAGGSARVFDADVYSPRYPQISHKVNERKFRALIERPAFQDASRDLGFKMSSELDDSTTRQNGMDAILESTVVQLAYARMNGIEVEIPMIEGYREGEMRADYYAVRNDLRERVGSDPAFMKWAEAEFGPAFEGERIFQGWTNAGNARYLPHDLDTVVRVLKRELRDGEGFNYGVGSIRSKVAREFRSLTAIKKARGQIVDGPTMEALKTEANDDFVALANRLIEKTGRTSTREQMGFLDTFSEHLKEVAETGRVSVMDQYYRDPLTPEDKADVVAFLEKLRAMPTEYFEAKIRRAVSLDEFVAAVVPEGTEQRVIDALRDVGVTNVSTYKKGDAQARALAVREAGSGALFQDAARGSIRYNSFKAGEFGSAVIRLGQSSDLSTFLHEFGHLGHLVLESMATDAEAPAEFKAMWENTLSWWGVDQATWDALSPEQRVPYFEQWARSFEAYLMEGQAPSLGLKEAFAAFREWLLQVYRSILRIDHNLNPQIRDVFDRLLATDGEIAEARAAMGADFQLSREAFGSEAEFQAYVTAIAAARDAQDAELRARIMDSYARKSKRWWRGERERVRNAATRAVDSDKARRAHDWLGFEEWKTLLSTATSDEGEVGYVASPNAMEDLPEDLPAMALDPAAIQADWPDVQLPIAINPRVDPDVVLAEAMRLKGVAKGRGGARAQRLATAVRSWGGVIDGDGRIRAAIGSGRKRPGLVNANGKTAEQLTARAAAEGYFGSGAAKLFLNEQQAEQIADEIRAARSVKPPKTLSAWVREQGGIADDRGDVAGGADDGKRGFARLIREGGRSLDNLALSAWEAGFFPDANERPGVAELIDALDAEARGERLASDVEGEANYASAQRLLSFWQSVGIETTLSREALKDALWGASDPNATQPLARELNQAKAPDAGSAGVSIEGASFTSERLSPEIRAIIDEHFGDGMAEVALRDRSGNTMLQWARELMDETDSARALAAVASMEEWALAQRAGSAQNLNAPRLVTDSAAGGATGRSAPTPASSPSLRNVTPNAPDGGARGGGSAPNEQAAYVQHLRDQGFDVDTPLYHGTNTDFDGGMPRASGAGGPQGHGIYLTADPSYASFFAEMREGGAPRLMTYYGRRGRIATQKEFNPIRNANVDREIARARSMVDEDEWSAEHPAFLKAIEDADMATATYLQQQGYIGVENRADGSVLYFSADDLAPQFGVRPRGGSSVATEAPTRGSDGETGFELFQSAPIIYHGSAKPLHGIRPVLFATPDRETAVFFARLDRKTTRGPRRLTPLQPNFENPMEVEANGSLINAMGTDRELWRLVEQAQANGNDAIIVHNVIDGPAMDMRSVYAQPIDVYIIIDPTKVEKLPAEYVDASPMLRGFLRLFGSFQLFQEPRRAVAEVLARVDNAAPDVPRNEIPRDQVRAAYPKVDASTRVSAREAMDDGEIVTSWATLQYRAGRDMIVGEDQGDARPVRKDIFDLTFEEVAPGEYAKRSDIPVGYFVVNDTRTIETLEGPVEAKPGDYVLIGGIGEMWPIKPAKFAERYDVAQAPIASDKAPTVEEFLTALIDDLTNARQVYSAKDAGALASAQDLADAQAWFEANDIDLTKDKEAIRAEIVAALEKASERENLYHPDDIAGWFGFSSGDELVQALAALKPRSVAIEEKIDQMLEEEHGDLNSPDKVNAAARLAAHAEAQANRIELELSALEKATKGRTRPVGKAARAYAERQIQRMTIKQVRNFDQYLSGERRAARNAMEATRKGDMAQASMWKQRQLISFWLYRFARDAAEEMDKAQSYFRKFDRDTVRAKIHAPLLDQIDQALESIDLRATPRVSNRRRQSFLAWYDEMKAEGLEHMVAVDPDFLDQVRQRPFNTLTLEEARGLRDAVKNFEHIGRRWREVLAARDNRLLDEAVAEMSASMAKVKPFEATNPADHSPGVVERLDTRRQKLHAQLSRVEFVARAMDGMKENGPVWNGLFRPLTEARDREETRQQQAQRDIEALFSVYDAKERADMWVKRKFYAQVPNRDGSRMGRNFTKQEILAIALNTGNEYNFNALLGGDNWTEQQVRALLNAAMDDRDWRFVQSLWDYVETFWPEIDALQRKATGVSLPKVEATPFQNRYGEWRGGYWHLEYDYGRDQRVREEAEHGKVQEAFGGFRMRTMTPHGFAKARQGSGGRPVRLDLAVLTEHVNEVIHDLEFRLPVLNTWRLIKHSEFRSAFVRAAGQEMYETLKPWLQYVATEQMPPERGFADILRLLRRNTPIALMGFALSTVAQQPAGLMGAFHRVGTGRVMGKVLELASQPWTWMEHARFINTRSTLMRNRSMISQREIREMVQEINSQGHIDAVTLLASGTVRQKMQAMTYLQKMMQRYAMFPLAYLDKWVSSAAWKAAYDRALAGHVEGVDASNEADVISYADHIVRTTFGSGRPEDMSPIMRSSELGKIMTPAFSYFNTQYNQLFNEQTPGMMRGQISPIEFATFITFAMVLQALVSQWLAGRWDPGDDEDEDDRNRRLALEVAMTPTAGIPLIRDITRAALMKASTGRPTFGTSVPAIGAITSTGIGIGGAIHDLSDDGEISRASARDLTMAAGYWFGLPSRQLWTTGSYVSDVATGEEEAPWKSDQPIDSWSEAFLRDTR